MNTVPSLLAQGISIKNKALTDSTQDLGSFDFVNNLLPNIIGAAFIAGAVFFFAILIIASINWISAGGDKARLEAAKSKITSALTGLIILIFIFAVFQLVNSLLGINVGVNDNSSLGSCEGITYTLNNNNFETGNTSGWEKVGPGSASATTGDVVDGQYKVELSKTSSSGYNIIRQKFNVNGSVNAGCRIDFSGWGKRTAPGANPRISIEIARSSNPDLVSYQEFGSSEWTKRTAFAIVPSDATQVRVNFFIPEGNSGIAYGDLFNMALAGQSSPTPIPNSNVIVGIVVPSANQVIGSIGQTAFEAYAYDTRATSGNGISYVHIELIGPGGNLIHGFDDPNGFEFGLYCLWGNASPCPKTNGTMWDSLLDGTYTFTAQAYSSIDGGWSALASRNFTIEKRGTCNISGPASITGGTTGTFTATWDFPGGNLDDAYISVTRTDLSGNWQTVYSELNPNPSNWTATWNATQIIDFPFVGYNYYVTCGATFGFGTHCSGDPWCEWEPNPPSTKTCYPGTVNCGSSDVITVYVAPPNAPTPTHIPSPTPTFGPGIFLNSSTGMSCNTYCNQVAGYPYNTCQVAGTDGSNKTFILYNSNTGQCYKYTTQGDGCGQNMVNWGVQCADPATGETHPAGWTYCTCI